MSASRWYAIASSRSFILPDCSERVKTARARLLRDMERPGWPVGRRVSASRRNVITSSSYPTADNEQESHQQGY